ncbi:MAG TPA: DUF1330 domain-containing protein [Dehalococcoidales bacterium]|nr:DUF1330 domain-containing protein [Dehalococcoidales bacterium]
MKVSNAVTPSPEQIQAFLASDLSGPVCMVNLLEFKPMAEYEDGRESNLPGREAYSLYGAQMREFCESKGCRFLFAGAVRQMIIGSVEEEWDAVAIVEYPSKEAFVEIALSPEVQEISIHRSAGLAGQLLIATTDGRIS